ncbi:MAG TPA: 5-(carboxyamino)imidazole ribonucleotide synthase [Streptosporangiaceae bacterium]|nr:5-(carboxyamino)imidazole ribonucleotide synthase [Streptosporangiaceae bacterium]
MSGARIGILGAGQLGLMLAQAARDLNVGCRFYAEMQDAPAASMGPVITGDQLARFAGGLEVVTYEWENIPVPTARRIEAITPVQPTVRALEASQDRLAEKTFFVELGEETARFAPVDSRESLDDAVAKLGLPLVLKTRRLGYDGQGQLILTQPFELDRAWRELGDSPLIAEQWVPFVRELSIIAVRGRDGTIACYPLVENTHHGGILRSSLAPVPELAAQTQAAAERCAIRVLEALDYVGVLAIELFDAGDLLLVNEMAPRVHNSGHLTIEGAVTSQFENHVRAILGLPLGDTSIPRPAVMVNLIGDHPPAAELLAVPGARLHLYGKSPRPGRKLGHVTVCADTMDQAVDRQRQIQAIVAAHQTRTESQK